MGAPSAGGLVCQPVLAAVTDAHPHVALQAIDLLGAGCAAPAAVSAVLQKEAEALPASGATWHRAAHAIVSLGKASPPDVRTLLPRFVGHPTWQVRMYAARAAGQTGAGIEALVRLGTRCARQRARGRARSAGAAEAARGARRGLRRADPARLPARDDGRARARGRDRQAQGDDGASGRRWRASRARGATRRAIRAWRS